MDMVNDGKVIRLDTPQAVKEALASGKDLYNPETGEFWWEYNYTGSFQALSRRSERGTPRRNKLPYRHPIRHQ